MRTVLACLGLLTPSLSMAAAVDFQRDVQPVLVKNCASCHGVNKQKAGLRLDSAAALLQGGDSGAVVVPGKSASSLLYQTMTGGGKAPRMPPRGGMAPAEIALVKAWIDGGATVPAQAKNAVPPPAQAQIPAPPPAPAERFNKDRRFKKDDDDKGERERETRKKAEEREREAAKKAREREREREKEKDDDKKEREDR